MTGRLARMVARLAVSETRLCGVVVGLGVKLAFERMLSSRLERKLLDQADQLDKAQAKVAELEGRLDELFTELGGGRA